MLNDVIAAASSSTNQIDEAPQSNLTRSFDSSNDSLQKNLSQPAECLKMSDNISKVLDKQPATPASAVSSASATTITSIVSPIVIPSFKVGMGNLIKHTATEEEILNTSNTNNGMLSTSYNSQGQ